MGVKDVYEVWDALELNMTDMLYSLLRSIEDKLYPLMERMWGEINHYIGSVRSDIAGVARKIMEFFDDIWTDLEDAFNYITDPIVEALTEGLDWIVDGVSGAIEGVTGAVQDAVDWLVDGLDTLDNTFSEWFDTANDWIAYAMGGMWTDLTTSMSDGIQGGWEWLTSTTSGVYDWISELLADAWEAFWFTAIPWLGDLFVRFIESEEVAILIEQVQNITLAVFNLLFTIDEEELGEWIYKAREFYSNLTQTATKGV